LVDSTYFGVTLPNVEIRTINFADEILITLAFPIDGEALAFEDILHLVQAFLDGQV
jgi:hypothetical protein